MAEPAPRTRYRRQRWSATAPLRFCRHMRIGDLRVYPGDPVTSEIRNLVGHKMPAWFRGGYVEVDFVKLDAQNAERAARRKGSRFADVSRANPNDAAGE
ncbi:MAG: hypothetical protein ACRDP6_26655 [Actinoallomurus sp.]